MQPAERLERAARSQSERPTRRGRPAAAGALLVALAAALVLVRTHPRSDVPAAAAPEPGTTITTATVADTSGLRALFADAGACADVPGDIARIHCLIDGVEVDAQLLDRASVEAAYANASAAEIQPRHGPPACARGHPDERAWSRPAEPTRAVGRYRCRFEGAHAAIWWTNERGLLAHALGADRDLGALFRWWRAHRDG